jgi:hypothetical protein
MACSREVLELEVWDSPPSTLRNVDDDPREVPSVFSAVATTEVEDVNGGPPRGAVGRSDSGHHRS